MSGTAPIRLVVSDVDGTMVTTDKRLTDATIDAATSLRDAGVMLALISSRPPRGLDMIIHRLGLSTPRAGFNGGEIIGADGTVMEQIWVPEAAARRAVDLLANRHVDIWLFADGDWLVQRLDGAYVDHEWRTVEIAPKVVESFDPFLARAGKLVGASTDFGLLERCEAEIHAAIGDAASVHRSQRYYLDITNTAANKGTGAKALAKILGVDLADTACIGDMTNDIPMLSVAGLGIAMGNAPQAVQARAHVVTGTNEADGWAEAIHRYVLPRAREVLP